MIRAVYRKGTIQPLDPLPADWQDGQELEVRELKAAEDTNWPPTPKETRGLGHRWRRSCRMVE